MAVEDVGLPFAEQIQAIRERTGNLVPTERWTDLMRNGHDRGFAVAGAAKADLLADFAASIDEAVAEGRSLDWFRQQFDEIVSRHGWAYTGERNWRTRVIYGTNMRTSYAAGRLAQLRDPELQEVAPYWMYRHGGSAEPRPHHVALDRQVLPADDPWWQTHYPPNGWGCSCYVVAVSEAQARRMGGRFDEPGEDPQGTIDPGWDYMPGETVAADIRAAVAEKMSGRPYDIAAPLLAAMNREAAETGRFRRWRERPDGGWPLARIPDEDADAISSRERVAMLTSPTIRRQDRDRPELRDTDYADTQSVIDRATHRLRVSERSILYGRLLGGEADSGAHILVAQTNATGRGLALTSLQRLSLDDARADVNVMRLLEEGAL